jgi:hypothetical protein
MLVRLGVGIDADDFRRGASEGGGSVALPAREVGQAESACALGDPLINGQVPAVPIVLLGDVGKRSLAGERERRHPFGLVFLDVGHESARI